MAEHVINLNEGQEATLRYAARRASLSTAGLLDAAVNRLLTEAAGDLNQRVDRAMESFELPPPERRRTRDRILRAFTGEPEPADLAPGHGGGPPER